MLNFFNAKNFIFFYKKQLQLNNRVLQSGLIEEEFLEIFDLIQEFPSAEDFASWITHQKFTCLVYKNEINDGTYSRGWEYTIENTSFLSGKLELDIKQIPKDLEKSLLTLNSPFCRTEPPLRIEKLNIHSILTEFHCTVLSHAVYKDLVIGNFWEVYDFSTLLKLYNKMQDPMRYWRKTRRE